MTEKTWPDDMHDRWRVAVFSDGRGNLNLMISCRTPGAGRDSKQLVVKPFQFEAVEPYGSVRELALSETYEEMRDGLGDVTNFLQAIVNAAWEHGIKPEAMKDHRGELGATKAHLEDMRTLVFKTPVEAKP